LAKKSVEEKETKGTATILVDETLEPVVEDEIIFQNQYKATILLESRSEKK
jgi:phosphate transport system substrate-binding protein